MAWRCGAPRAKGDTARKPPPTRLGEAAVPVVWANCRSASEDRPGDLYGSIFRTFGITGCDAYRGGAANRTTRTAERDIRGIGGPHTGLGCLTGPYGRCTVALNPRKESRIPHYRKPEKHCDINYLSRGGAGSLERTRLPRIPC